MQSKKKIAILGAGISGLAAAYYLSKTRPEIACTILEKNLTAGGHIDTEETENGILEKGPRIFKTSTNVDFLELIQETGFSHELVFSAKEAKKRYLLSNGKLKTIFSVNAMVLLQALFSEWRKSPVEKEETIEEFAIRRFGKKASETLFDPMVQGIYAGTIKELSVNACFPILKKWEKEKGSVLKGILFSVFQKKNPSLPSLFSFRQGSGSFIRHLEKIIPYPILYGKEVTKLEKLNEKFLIFSGTEMFDADEIICALPSYHAASLLEPLQKEVSSRLLNIPYQSITSANILIETNTLQYPGFGYLIPSIQKDPILGMLFDSSIFPKQGESFTKFTLMIRGSHHTEEEILSMVKRALTTHLKISSPPHKISFKKMDRAIPQYILGHKENISKIRDLLPVGISLVGNYLDGISVNDAIRSTKFQYTPDFQATY